ncbi:MAG: ATP-binding cassette domain-containing protein [Alphaproteobacteria bacterium]|nr:ATP-binding cassette domain-containing protein [Alphaproteobacteria bacterium]
MNILEIKNLSVSLDGKPLLKDINMNVAAGGRHLLRGANGSGKTSLVMAISGNPDYKTDGGKIIFDGADITALPAEMRARTGIFTGAQNVPEIPGLSVASFLKHSFLSHNPKLAAGEFLERLIQARTKLDIPESWLGRSVNVGFSGGEKKRLMFLHLLLLRPRLAILDEPDSGADADAQKLFAKIITELNKNGTTFLVVSHQEKFMDMIGNTGITTLSDGKIVV